MKEPAHRDVRTLQAIKLSEILSFGPGGEDIPLASLNVLIGPNGSGKSNLIEAIALLRATVSDLREVIVRGGGTAEWVWKGSPNGLATIEATVRDSKGQQSLQHFLAFSSAGQSFTLDLELIERPDQDGAHERPYYEFQYGKATLRQAGHSQERREIEVTRDKSILAQLRDPITYPEMANIGDIYNAIRIYRDWSFGRVSVFRSPQRVDMRTDRLEEDFSNLGLFLNHLRGNPRAKQALLSALRNLYEGIDDFDVSIEGGTVQVFLTEREFTIPATRLSDGTLRYLCLLAILCDPNPPPLVCIEEPELGLHPDILPKLADLLIDASERMQLIVTTHSDVLVDAMTERPEAVLVCEKHDGQTTIRRLHSDDLAEWLKSYRLGELWTRGDIGGTRW